MQVCEYSGKRCFPSQQTALKAARLREVRRHTKRRGSSYYCHLCRSWHITHFTFDKNREWVEGLATTPNQTLSKRDYYDSRFQKRVNGRNHWAHHRHDYYDAHTDERVLYYVPIHGERFFHKRRKYYRNGGYDRKRRKNKSSVNASKQTTRVLQRYTPIWWKAQESTEPRPQALRLFDELIIDNS